MIVNSKKDQVVLFSEPPKPKPVPGSRIGTWEKEEILSCLAITGNIQETARRTGRSPAVVHKLFHENFELIARARERLGRTLRDDLAATALEVQATIRYLVALIREAEDPATLAVVLAPATFDLAKTGAISAERYALLAEATQKIEPAAVVTPDEREGDKAYLRVLVREILKEEGEGERREA